MTDKELLEKAAKAAGIEIRGNANKWIAQGVTELDLLVWNDRGGDSVWNPLTDDGQALRLAVKLGLCMFIDLNFDAITDVFKYGFSEEGTEEDHRNDPYEATRRAIVRAAAEIGKGMV